MLGLNSVNFNLILNTNAQIHPKFSDKVQPLLPEHAFHIFLTIAYAQSERILQQSVTKVCKTRVTQIPPVCKEIAK